MAFYELHNQLKKLQNLCPPIDWTGQDQCILQKLSLQCYLIQGVFKNIDELLYRTYVETLSIFYSDVDLFWRPLLTTLDIALKSAFEELLILWKNLIIK